MLALSVVVAVAVLREGSEVVLFLYGVAATSGSGSAASLIAGLIIGLVLGGSVSSLAYLGHVRIPTRHLFVVTSGLITLLAAGMAAQGVAFLEQAGAVSWLGQEAWDSSALLSQASVIGRALHTLVGYTDQPSYLQLVVYLTVVLAIWCLTRLFSLPAARPFGAPASAR
jgi:high-affinity iron transporter